MSIREALKTWSARKWYKLALKQNTSVKDLKDKLRFWLSQGKEFF